MKRRARPAITADPAPPQPPAEPRAFPCARCSRPGAACYGTRSLPSGVTRYRKCPRCAFTFVTHQPHPAPDGSVGPEVLS